MLKPPLLVLPTKDADEYLAKQKDFLFLDYVGWNFKTEECFQTIFALGLYTVDKVAFKVEIYDIVYYFCVYR